MTQDNETRVTLATRDLRDGKIVESVGAHYSPAQWRSETGGYVGHVNWRDGHGMGTQSRCGHKHVTEGEALACIGAILSQARAAAEAEALTAARAGAELLSEYGDLNDILSEVQKAALARFSREGEQR